MSKPPRDTQYNLCHLFDNRANVLQPYFATDTDATHFITQAFRVAAEEVSGQSNTRRVLVALAMATLFDYIAGVITGNDVAMGKIFGVIMGVGILTVFASLVTDGLGLTDSDLLIDRGSRVVGRQYDKPENGFGLLVNARGNKRVYERAEEMIDNYIAARRSPASVKVSAAAGSRPT